MVEKNSKNILDYVKEEIKTFSEKPFNDVDSLVLSQLAYVRFNGLVGGMAENRVPVSLWELLKAEHFNSMFSNGLDSEKNRELLYAMVASPRFRDIKLNYYDERTDKNVQQQFSSVTYLMPFGAAYIAFRGTDTTIIGWKEDFNMAFMQVIPSQKSAVKQLEKVAKITDLPLILGGHSKGGNLAVYAGAKCKWDVFERITDIYNHDGPGFRKDVIASGGFENVWQKVKKTVPEFSLIGMLLLHYDNYKVVCSTEKFLMQHDPYSWRIHNGDFVYVDEIAGEANAINQSIREWLERIDDDFRERFIDTLFKVITSSGAERVQDFGEEWRKNAASILEAFKELDPDTRRFIFSTMNSLAALSIKNIRGISRNRDACDVKTIDE